MKKLLFIIGILALVSCASIEPATSYYFTPRAGQTDDVGKITQVLERNGYSIIIVENLVQPIYVNGRISDINTPSDTNAYVWKEKNRQHLVFNNKRYLIEENPGL